MTILAIDFGGTQVKSALVSEEFALEKSLPTQSSPQTLNQTLDVIDYLVTSVKVALTGIAISVPGTVDTDEGVIYHEACCDSSTVFVSKTSLKPSIIYQSRLLMMGKQQL